MSALYDDADLFIKKRPLPKGTLVRYYDLENNECTGRVKDASLYMLWIEDLEDRDRTIFIRYKDLTAVLEQEQYSRERSLSYGSDASYVATYVGAAPIGLIDGEKLLDLLIKYDIGVKKRSISLYEIDEEYLRASDTLQEAENTLTEELV